MFLGDSVQRYQYLELAYYVVYGRCPSRAGKHFILAEVRDDNWTKFYQESSEQLNRSDDFYQSTEVCFCTRLALEPGLVHEQRLFQYSDLQARTSSNADWNCLQVLVEHGLVGLSKLLAVSSIPCVCLVVGCKAWLIGGAATVGEHLHTLAGAIAA